LSLVVLPVQLPYEEDKILSSSITGFKNFALTISQVFSTLSYNQSVKVTRLINFVTIYPTRIACFQVSPIQKFLIG